MSACYEYITKLDEKIRINQLPDEIYSDVDDDIDCCDVCDDSFIYEGKNINVHHFKIGKRVSVCIRCICHECNTIGNPVHNSCGWVSDLNKGKDGNWYCVKCQEKKNIAN